MRSGFGIDGDPTLVDVVPDPILGLFLLGVFTFEFLSSGFGGFGGGCDGGPSGRRWSRRGSKVH